MFIQLDKLKWLHIALNDLCCLIYHMFSNVYPWMPKICKIEVKSLFIFILVVWLMYVTLPWQQGSIQISLN